MNSHLEVRVAVADYGIKLKGCLDEPDHFVLRTLNLFSGVMVWIAAIGQGADRTPSRPITPRRQVEESRARVLL